MNRLFYIGAVIAIIFIFTAIFAPQIATHDPIQSIEYTDPATNTTKTLRYAPPSKENWFGTDDLGRDVFSRLVYGARVSLMVGISVVFISAIIGIFIGAIAGFYGSIRFFRVTFSTSFSRFPVCFWQSPSSLFLAERSRRPTNACAI